MSKTKNNQNKLKPIDVDKIDLNVLKEKTTDIPGLLEYAHSVGGFQIIPTEKGMIKNNALSAMHEQTQMQMDQLYQQMKLLAKQASDLQERADISHTIYNSDISFQPVIGETYYLYEKKNGKTVLSMISPEEWGKIPFEKFLATCKLLADHTWKINKAE